MCRNSAIANTIFFTTLIGIGTKTIDLYYTKHNNIINNKINNIEINKTSLFKNTSVHKHCTKYSNDKVKYTRSHNKVEIKCNTCMNTFHQSPRHHLSRNNCCPQCFKNTKFTQNTFI